MKHISFTNRFVGSCITQSTQGPEIKAKKVLDSLVNRLLVLTLPIFHAIDASYYLFHYAKASLAKKQLVEIAKEQIQKSACLNLAKSHFISLFTSLPVGLKNPVDALKWGRSKKGSCRRGELPLSFIPIRV